MTPAQLTLPGSLKSPFLSAAGEEALTMYMDKSRLDRKSGNATQSVEALHQLASSYFVDRDGTMRRLHEIQISTGAIKVPLAASGRAKRLHGFSRDLGQDFVSLMSSSITSCFIPRVSYSLTQLKN